MKVSTKFKLMWSALLMFLFNMTLYAQDKKVDIDVKVGKEGGGQWYANPIVWVVGGAVFILLLVALLRGRNKA